MSSCPSSHNKIHHSPDSSPQLLTRVLPANTHPQTCPYPAKSQVTASPWPSQPQHRAASQDSHCPCFLLLSQARQAPGKATGTGKIQSNTDVRKPLTQQTHRQLQTLGTACSTTSSQAALCCTAQGKLNPNIGKTDLLVAQENPHSLFQLMGEGALRSCTAQGQIKRWNSAD